MEKRKIEVLVGLFIVGALAALLLLALRVVGDNMLDGGNSYRLQARFDNIGGLKERAPVKIGGVVVGRVDNIVLDGQSWVPVVEMVIDSRYSGLSEHSSAAVLTSGLLGEQYVGITPGFIDEEEGTALLKDGGSIRDTKSALVFENLISQFLYNQDNK
ncbi:MAG: outer membrane lipid asymmetry maintenance protein MlaD [Gammaproteobacteria bacterium]|nr:outer membrane lipid asymmetry maintenance protein MlaD [Gammaproteobacteria bacterium]